MVRSADGQPSKIIGYAAVFYRNDDPGTEYELYSFGNYRVVERLMPMAFDRAVKEDDVRALFNHDAGVILGRSGARTLRLIVDGKGLRYEIDPPDTQSARDLIQSLKRGDITGSSFSFDYLAKDVIQKKEADGSELDVIEVRDVRLFDVGPVVFPAYASSTAGFRSLAEARATVRGAQRSTAESRRQRIEQIEAELAELDRRQAPEPPVSRLTRRQRIRERNQRVLAQIENDAIGLMALEVEEIRRDFHAAMERRRS